jgi:hypothetical protein
MTQDLTGLLLNAANCIKNDPAGYKHDLRQLAANLHELRGEWAKGANQSRSSLNQFFRIYGSSPVTHETWPAGRRS